MQRFRTPPISKQNPLTKGIFAMYAKIGGDKMFALSSRGSGYGRAYSYYIRNY